MRLELGQRPPITSFPTRCTPTPSFALFIIAGIGASILIGIGISGCLSVKSVRNLSQHASIALLTLGASTQCGLIVFTIMRAIKKVEPIESLPQNLCLPETMVSKDHTILPNFKNAMKVCLVTKTSDHPPHPQFLRILQDSPYEFHDNVLKVVKQELCEEEVPYSKYFPFPLKVCPCKKMLPSLREKLENRSIERIAAIHPKDASLTIISIGSGELFQELVYLTKLVNAGYREFTLILIEPQHILLGVLEDCCKRFLSHCQITIVHYREIIDCVEDMCTPDLLLLIDLDDEQFDVIFSPDDSYPDKLPLPDFAYQEFQGTGLLKPNCTIAYSSLTQISFKEFIPQALSCRYDNAATLREISDKDILT